MTEEKFFFEKNVFSKENYKFTFEKNEEIIKEILKYKTKGSILDLGCGEAGTSFELAKKGFNITCLDISKTAINKIKEEAIRRGIKIKTIIADLENYSINENYDIVIATGVFHFLPQKNMLDLIQKSKTHTNKNGLNIFEVFLKGDPSQEEDSEGHYFEPSELRKLYSDWEILNYKEYEDYDKEENQTNKLAFLIAKKS